MKGGTILPFESIPVLLEDSAGPAARTSFGLRHRATWKAEFAVEIDRDAEAHNSPRSHPSAALCSATLVSQILRAIGAPMSPLRSNCEYASDTRNCPCRRYGIAAAQKSFGRARGTLPGAVRHSIVVRHEHAFSSGETPTGPQVY